jgi:cyclohexanecarboxylate-CoA ligase
VSRLLGSVLEDAAQVASDRVAVVDGDTRLTYAELANRVARFASSLRTRGVRRGDVVSWQLPNWWEAMVAHHAIVRLGAVSNPLMPILRERELRFILTQARSRVAIVPDRFRGFDYAQMADEIFPELDDLAHIVVVRPAADSERSFDALLVEQGAEAPETGEPEDHVLLLYTSGTEAVAKGVLHSHETLAYEVRSIRDWFALSADDVVFMPSPVGHITGVLYGLHLPALLMTTAVFQDVWDPGVGLDLIERECCSFTVAATPFLHALAYHPRLREHDVRCLRVFACGGADVSPKLVTDATGLLDCTVVRVYGSTEFPTLCAGRNEDDLAERAGNDGRIIVPAEGRVRTSAGVLAGPGAVGDLEVRGPEAFLGYLDDSLNAAAFTEDGWFRTGDLAAIDERGYVRISGRVKDIIIRGGENISSKEVEDLILEHPDVAEVAIVAMPDPVLGERACAFAVPVPEREPTLADLVEHLESRRIARQKLPERLEFVPELPKTASGKVQKFVLRERISAMLAAEREAAAGGGRRQ